MKQFSPYRSEGIWHRYHIFLFGLLYLGTPCRFVLRLSDDITTVDVTRIPPYSLVRTRDGPCQTWLFIFFCQLGKAEKGGKRRTFIKTVSDVIAHLVSFLNNCVQEQNVDSGAQFEREKRVGMKFVSLATDDQQEEGLLLKEKKRGSACSQKMNTQNIYIFFNVLAARKSCPAFRFDRKFADYFVLQCLVVSRSLLRFIRTMEMMGRRQSVFERLSHPVWGWRGWASGGAFAGF